MHIFGRKYLAGSVGFLSRRISIRQKMGLYFSARNRVLYGLHHKSVRRHAFAFGSWLGPGFPLIG